MGAWLGSFFNYPLGLCFFLPAGAHPVHYVCCVHPYAVNSLILHVPSVSLRPYGLVGDIIAFYLLVGLTVPWARARFILDE